VAPASGRQALITPSNTLFQVHTPKIGGEDPPPRLCTAVPVAQRISEPLPCKNIMYNIYLKRAVRRHMGYGGSQWLNPQYCFWSMDKNLYGFGGLYCNPSPLYSCFQQLSHPPLSLTWKALRSAEGQTPFLSTFLARPPPQLPAMYLPQHAYSACLLIPYFCATFLPYEFTAILCVWLLLLLLLLLTTTGYYFLYKKKSQTLG